MRNRIFLLLSFMAMLIAVRAVAQERTIYEFYRDNGNCHLYQNDYDTIFVANLKLEVSGFEDVVQNYSNGPSWASCTVTVTYDLSDLEQEYRAFMEAGNKVTLSLNRNNCYDWGSGIVYAYDYDSEKIVNLYTGYDPVASVALPNGFPMKGKHTFEFTGWPAKELPFEANRVYYLSASITKPGTFSVLWGDVYETIKGVATPTILSVPSRSY